MCYSTAIKNIQATVVDQDFRFVLMRLLNTHSPTHSLTHQMCFWTKTRLALEIWNSQHLLPFFSCRKPQILLEPT